MNRLIREGSATTICLGHNTFYFSHSILVALAQSSPKGDWDGKFVRLKSPSAATTMHIRKMCCEKSEIVSQVVFDSIVRDICPEL